MKSNFDILVGKWVHKAEWDTDDWMSEYEIAGTEDAPRVRARDLNDGEEYCISNIKWDGHVLEFVTEMPSTRRKGINRFKIKTDADSEIESEFTFTEYDTMKKINT